MECRVVRSGTQQCDTPSEWASWYVYSGAICALSKAISEAISGCAASTAPQITEFTVMGYPPLLLSDKHQLFTSFVSSSALDNLSLFVFCLAFDKSSKAIDYKNMKKIPDISQSK